MGISAVSLFENNKHIKELTIYLLGEKICGKNKDILKIIADKYKRKIIIIDVPKIDIPQSLVSSRWPLSAFTRLYAGQLLPESINKILYLDCDTIVKGNIEDLELIKLDSNLFWGTKDCIGSIYKKNIGLKKNCAYINAGVLLINLKELRKVDIKYVIDRYMSQFQRSVNYADQDILNGVFWNRIGTLKPEYDVMTINAVYTYEEITALRSPTNFYTKQELERAVREPIIIHYTTNMTTIRPWFKNTDHPFADEFRKYMFLSPWKGKELSDMVFDSKESKIIAAIINVFPKRASYRILGLLHSKLKPLYIRFKAKAIV